MRDYAPLCPDCSGVFCQNLRQFIPAETLNLISPSLAFSMVPAGMGGIGVTMHRAIAWEVVTCRRLTFAITSGTVDLRSIETAQTWTIHIVANTIARPGSADALVLDRSGSMGEDAGDAISKVQKLCEAANIFISLMLPRDGIGLVRLSRRPNG